MNQWLAQASQTLALAAAAVAAGALVPSWVLRWTGGAAGSRLARDFAVDELSAAARAGPDIAAVQTQAGRPR